MSMSSRVPALADNTIKEEEESDYDEPLSPYMEWAYYNQATSRENDRCLFSGTIDGTSSKIALLTNRKLLLLSPLDHYNPLQVIDEKLDPLIVSK